MDSIIVNDSFRFRWIILRFLRGFGSVTSPAIMPRSVARAAGPLQALSASLARLIWVPTTVLQYFLRSGPG